ncbi:MAG: 50S ribosomal protein L30 [Candidatus Micrarchaeota archaeon]
MGKIIAVVRIRGVQRIRPNARYSMKHLGLTRKHHCVLIDEKQRQMAVACKDYVAWGEPTVETIAELLEKRGRVTGDKLLKDNLPKGFASIQDLAKAVFEGTAFLSKLKGVKRVFRLHPPKKGFGAIKRAYPKGALGYWKQDINGLLERMM